MQACDFCYVYFSIILYLPIYIFRTKILLNITWKWTYNIELKTRPLNATVLLFSHLRRIFPKSAFLQKDIETIHYQFGMAVVSGTPDVGIAPHNVFWINVAFYLSPTT